MLRRKKGEEHPPVRGRIRISMLSFRVHQDVTGRHSSTSTEKRIRTPTAARPRYNVVVIVPRAPRLDQTVE
ncbi:hypothetical protein TNCV_1999021 [Trichonephila clavipes]|nr:hypothetical protein TNCV_1999021 [Trichonephila clavipes]